VDTPTPSPLPATPSRFGFLRLSHQHTALSATLLLTAFALLSRVIGLVRDKYIAYTFGAGAGTDAYNVAFQLPDLINYLLIGGAASISFVTILSRYKESGQQAEGDRALSVILNTMLLVLGSAILLAELLVPLFSRFYFPDDPTQAALCTLMTRLILPGQIFFFAGGVLASVALVRKQFAYQAIAPLVYNVFIILGGVFLAHTLGIPSLAVGVLVGAFAGPFLVNGYAAFKAGVRYQPILDRHNEGLRAWVRMSLPLMLGVTVVFMDSNILSWFAKHTAGDISRLLNAKKLFTAPMAIVGQAAGAASFPFFASLYSRGQFADYAAAVNRSVSRILSASLLLSSGMFALALPAVDLIFRGGRYTRADAESTALYFAVFSVSLSLWSTQTIYSRAFFAAGETRAPMVAGTVITVVSLPIYWLLHNQFGSIGLAWASNLAIALQTVTLAVLAHRRFLVPLYGPQGGLDQYEITRTAFAAFVSAAGLHLVTPLIPTGLSHLGDTIVLILGGTLWAALCLFTLHLTNSKFATPLLSRLPARLRP
jgi:putative peptidoglycan lipid II flippase